MTLTASDFDAFLDEHGHGPRPWSPTYDDYADLLGYMDGSAAVIGTMMLPILDAADPAVARVNRPANSASRSS